ncbi:basic salivary proline-rich protein 4-like [Columba livia]|uniref:basic salivary proline-rich protein 4-like n=1 Tax=Columba livia TaxID=8932 RepID=UPI0031BBB253
MFLKEPSSAGTEDSRSPAGTAGFRAGAGSAAPREELCPGKRSRPQRSSRGILQGSPRVCARPQRRPRRAAASLECPDLGSSLPQLASVLAGFRHSLGATLPGASLLPVSGRKTGLNCFTPRPCSRGGRCATGGGHMRIFRLEPRLWRSPPTPAESTTPPPTAVQQQASPFIYSCRHVILSPANTSDFRNKYIPAPGAANLPPRTSTASLPLPRDRKPPEPRGDPPPPSHRRETGVSRSEPRERSPPGKRCGALRAAARPTLAPESSEKLMAEGAAGPVSPGPREPPLSSGQRNVNRTTGSAGEPLCAPPPLGSGRGPS